MVVYKTPGLLLQTISCITQGIAGLFASVAIKQSFTSKVQRLQLLAKMLDLIVSQLNQSFLNASCLI